MKDDDKIKNLVKNNKYITTENIKNELSKENIKVSRQTIARKLQSLNFAYIEPKCKPLLTDKQILKRIEWCNKYINFNWDNVKFTDESSFWLEFKGKRWVNLNENVNDYDYRVKHPVKVNVWGLISKNFERKLFIFMEILDAKKYMEILKTNLGSEKNFILQDDNDPKHRAKIITKWKSENNINSLDWPSNSLDLNPIENIWGILKNKVNKRDNKNLEEFKNNIIECWNEIKKEHIDNTINSMPKRIQMVLTNKGKSINY